MLGVGVDGAVPGGLLGFTLLRDPVGAMGDAVGTLPSVIGVKVNKNNNQGTREAPISNSKVERPSAQPVTC